MKKKKSESLKKELIKSRNIIKRKFQELKKKRLEANKAIERSLKPLVDPLNIIAQNIKKEPKVNETLKQEKKEFLETDEKKMETKSESEDENASPARSSKRKLEESHFIIQRKRKKSLPNISLDDDDNEDNMEVSFLPTDVIAESHTSPGTSHDRSSLEIIQDQYETPQGRYQIDAMLKDFNELPKKYLRLLISDRLGQADYTYGVRFDADHQQWMIGNAPIEIQNDDFIIYNNKFKGTEGLYNLLFMKHPDKDEYDEDDLKRYGRILTITNAHKRGWKHDAPINGNKSYKYTHIIKKLFPIADRQRNRLFSTPGMGLHLSANKPRYIYWNSINELIDRLRLLYAEKNAGNNSVDNEITSILEELSEEGIIGKK